MSVLPVGGEENARPQLAQDAGELGAGGEVGFEPAVGQAEVAPPGEAENRSGRVGFSAANLGAAVRRRLAIGQVEDADAGALGLQQQDRPADAQLGVVGMRGDNEIIERLHSFFIHPRKLIHPGGVGDYATFSASGWVGSAPVPPPFGDGWRSQWDGTARTLAPLLAAERMDAMGWNLLAWREEMGRIIRRGACRNSGSAAEKVVFPHNE